MKRSYLAVIGLILVSGISLGLSTGCDDRGEIRTIDTDHASFGSAEDYAAYDQRASELGRGQEE